MMRLCEGSEKDPSYRFRNPVIGTCAVCKRVKSIRKDGKIRRHGIREA